MYFLENELPTEITDGFIHVVAYKAYWLQGSEFRRLHIDKHLDDSDELIEYLGSYSDNSKDNYNSSWAGKMDSNIKNFCEGYNDANIDKEYDDALNELTPVERCWAREVVKRNMSINLLSQHTGIHRDSAKARMNSIYDKLRK